MVVMMVQMTEMWIVMVMDKMMIWSCYVKLKIWLNGEMIYMNIIFKLNEWVYLQKSYPVQFRIHIEILFGVISFSFKSWL